jgi:hypothetical protein
VKWSGNVAMVYGGIGILSSAIALWFFFLSPLGRAERYLPGGDLAAPPEPSGVPMDELAGEIGPTFGQDSEADVST